MSWIDRYFAGYSTIQQNGIAVPQRATLNVIGINVTDNPTTQVTNFSVYPLTNPSVTGLTLWLPGTLAPATTANIYSSIFTAQTTAAAHTSVQVGPNIPLPGQSGTPAAPTGPANGKLRIDYELDVQGQNTAVSSTFKGNWQWSVHSSTVNTEGASPNQSYAAGTNSGSVPSGWSATLQTSSGQAQLIVTSDSSDTYTCKALMQWGYTF